MFSRNLKQTPQAFSFARKEKREVGGLAEAMNNQKKQFMINIPKLLTQGEGLTIEFKRAKNDLPSSLFETVCAFLNRSGGNILLGISDAKTIEGVEPRLAETMCKNIANLSNNPQKLFPKNPNIANVFTQMGRSEELGTGVKNVFKYSKAYSGSDQIVFEENDVFIAKVPLSDAIYSTDEHSGKPEERLNEGVSEGVSEGVNELLNLIANNPGKRTPFFEERLNVPVKTIERWLKRLKDNGSVYFKGAAKTGGYWKS